MKMVVPHGGIYIGRYGSSPALSNTCILIKEISNTLGTAKTLIFCNVAKCFDLARSSSG
jgi:hypothetical protein